MVLLTDVLSYAPSKELEKDAKCYQNMLRSFKKYVNQSTHCAGQAPFCFRFRILEHAFGNNANASADNTTDVNLVVKILNFCNLLLHKMTQTKDTGTFLFFSIALLFASGTVRCHFHWKYFGHRCGDIRKFEALWTPYCSVCSVDVFGVAFSATAGSCLQFVWSCCCHCNRFSWHCRHFLVCIQSSELWHETASEVP